MANIHPFIMCGGSGTRLWPVSTPDRPKQYHSFGSDRSLFELTLDRTSGPSRHTVSKPSVIGSEKQRAILEDYADRLGRIVLEPVGRNTAAVAALAALLASEDDPKGALLLMPADHVILDEEAFWSAVDEAADVATAHRKLVTLGLTPTHAETGYGYIERGAEVDGRTSLVEAFHEKPTADVAETYVATGQHFWNAGIFVLDKPTLLAELQRHAPDVLAKTRAALESAEANGASLTFPESIFAEIPSISFDYAIMEKTDAACVVAPLDLGWFDIGAWDAFASFMEKHGPQLDTDTGSPGHILIDSPGSFAHTQGRVAAIVGLPDLLLISSEEGILAIDRKQAQRVREVVAKLKAADGSP